MRSSGDGYRSKGACNEHRRLATHGLPTDGRARLAIERARVAPMPPEPLEVWIGAAAPVAIDLAARLGDAFLIGPDATPAEVVQLVRVYREACSRHGRTPSTIAVRRDVHVARDDAR